MKGNDYSWKLPDIDTLKTLYFETKMSASAIANKFRVTEGAVKNKLNRYGISLRSLSESQNLVANHINLAMIDMDFIDGLLLGDGSISLSPQSLSACYRHTDKNAEYITWLSEALTSRGIEISSLYYSPKAWHLATKFYREFVAIRDRWYPNGLKRVPFDIQLKPITILNWYTGDGNYHKPTSDGVGEQLTFAMQYDEQGKDLLHTKLYELGIANTSHKDCIYIRSCGRQRLFNYMVEANITIPSCYLYKFPWRYYHANEQS